MSCDIEADCCVRYSSTRVRQLLVSGCPQSVKGEESASVRETGYQQRVRKVCKVVVVVVALVKVLVVLVLLVVVGGDGGCDVGAPNAVICCEVAG
jgi:hypothetical protein